MSKKSGAQVTKSQVTSRQVTNSFVITDNVRRVIGLAIFFMSFWVTGCYSQNITAIRQDVKENITDSVKKDPYLWDFGMVKENVILEHEFIFKNESKVVLNIKDINTSCGCTISEVKQKKLMPGESTVIGVKFNSKGYSGAVTQYVYMNSDSLDNPIVRYIIKAEVEK